MSKNSNLHNAKRLKNDEFYTQFEDIEKELKHYLPYLYGKTVYCNCDNETSNFVKYFKSLNHIILIHTSDDFRLHTDLIQQADIIITNPPYSLLSEFITLMLEFDKDFLIIGTQNTITYREVFKAIQSNKIRLGYNCVRWFVRPDGTLKEGARSYWLTTLPVDKEKQLNLKEHYSPEKYPAYDNYPAIEVGRSKLIPLDYDGVMGVPVSFMEKYNQNQFELIDINPYFFNTIPKPRQLTVNNKAVYSRLLIKKL